MPNKYLIQLLTTYALALFISPAWGKSDTTPQITFTCEDDGGLPITVANNSEEKTQTIFHWKTEALPDSMDSQELCSSVSTKLNKYATEGYDLSKLGFRATNETGFPAICVTEEYSGCNEVLFTFAPAEKPTDTTSDILATIIDSKILDKGNPSEFLEQEELWIIIDLFQLFQDE